MNDASFEESRSGGDAVEAADPCPPGNDRIRGLLFDAALRSLGRAGRALGNSGAGVSAMGLSELARTRRTIDELRVRALVESAGDVAGDTADTLVSLYEFCTDRLARAAQTRDPELIAAVEDVLTELRDAFGDETTGVTD